MLQQTYQKMAICFVDGAVNEQTCNEAGNNHR